MKIRTGGRMAASALVALSAMTLASLPQQNVAYAQSGKKLEDSVIFALPGGPIQDALKVCIDNDFTKKFNVRVDILSILAPQALAKIVLQRSSPGIDVAWTTESTEYTGFKEGLFVPITPSLVPNIVNIDPKLEPQPDKGAMFVLSIQGIQYNTKVFKERGWSPPKSWRDLWDPKYKGHVGIYGLGAGSGQALVAIAAFLNGGDLKNFDTPFEYLAKLKPNLYTIFSQPPQFDAALINEQVWLGIQAAPRPVAMMRQGAPVSWVQPEEGTIVNKLNLQIVKNGPNPNAAAAFVNWTLSKEAQSCLPAGYSPVVKGVQVPADLAPFITLRVPIIPLDAVAMEEKLPELLKRWNKEMEGN